MKLGFICLNVPGQLNRMTALAGKEAEIERGHRIALFWLISLAALISLLVAILWLMESARARKAGPDQLDLYAEGVQIQGEVTLGRALQALSVRH
jgi:hypothetical protein